MELEGFRSRDREVVVLRKCADELSVRHRSLHVWRCQISIVVEWGLFRNMKICRARHDSKHWLAEL